MATIVDTATVCDCCAGMIANGDESGCRDYWNHTHPTCGLPMGAALGDEEREVWSTWTCDGCGEDQLPGGRQWPVVILG